MLLAMGAVASPFAKPSEDSAKLVLGHSQPTKQLFEMRLQAVNGENVLDRGQAVWLKPGEYELTFSSKIDNRHTKNQVSVALKKDRNLQNTINITVDGGKTYYMAYDASDRDRQNWKPVVYKSE